MEQLNEKKLYQYPEKDETLILSPSSTEVKYDIQYINPIAGTPERYEPLKYQVIVEATNKTFTILSNTPLKTGETITDSKDVYFIKSAEESKIIVNNLTETATKVLNLEQFENEFVYVPIKKEILERIQEFSECTNEIYESQSYEDLVNNILVTEKLRLKKLQK